MSDLLSYSVNGNHGHAYSGSVFHDRDKAIAHAEYLRAEGWTATIAIYGTVEGYETWRGITDLAVSPPPSDPVL